METPAAHPAAWRGAELFERADWERALDPAQLAELERATAADDAQPSPLGPTALPRLTPLLEDLRHDLEHGSGATLVRGLPVRRWGATRARRAFWVLASAVGTPLAQSAAGERLFRVRDEGFAEGDPRARGPSSRRRLGFHTDRCDVIAFLCLRQARSGGDSLLVSSMALYRELRARRPDLAAALERPVLYRRHTVDPANPHPTYALPVFSEREGHFAASYLRVLIDRAHRDPELPDLPPDQLEALDLLDALAEREDLHVRLRLRPGDLLFVNNWVLFHRRDAFAPPSAGEAPRELLRIWLAVPGSRPLDAAFGPLFGGTEAGAVRGGMRTREGTPPSEPSAEP